MGAIEDIASDDALMAWFDALPHSTPEEEYASRQLIIIVGARAAARVLPSTVKHDLKRLESGQGPFPFVSAFRAVLISYVAAFEQSSEYRSYATEASRAMQELADTDMRSYHLFRAAYNASVAADASFLGASVNAATVAFRTGFWPEIQSDLKSAISGRDLSNLPLWSENGDNPGDWDEVAGGLKSQSGFLHWWYQKLLDGTAPAPDSPMMLEIARLKDAVWKDEAAALARIEEIWRRSQVASDNQEALLIAHRLMEAALSDFRFDQARRLMQMTPFAQDLKVLKDPTKLESFLSDAEELRDDIDSLAAGLRREGSAMQGAGLVSLELERISEEFSKARQLNSLNVGAIIKFGDFLHEASVDEATRREFGLAAKKLDQIVQGVLDLVRSYFGQSLLRFAPLEQLKLEEGTNAWEYLNELRNALRDMLPETAGNIVTPLAAEDVQILETLANEVERVLRAHDMAGGEAKSSFKREVNYRFALLTVTLSFFFVRAREHEKALSPYVEGLLKLFNQAKGLYTIWQVIKSLLRP